MGLSTSTHAQTDDPAAILEASAAAIAEVPGFNAQFQMKGVGAALFADTLPSMNGQLFFGTHEELGRVIHCIGEAKDQQNAVPQAIDIVLTSDRYLWTDHAKQEIYERPNNRTSRGTPPAFNLVLIQSMLMDAPFQNDTDGSLSMKVLAQETIAGSLCDVVEINRFKAGSSKRRSPSDSYTDVRWYIGTQDKLPRKVEQITDAGLVKITLLFQFGRINLIEPSQSDLDIARPASYKFISTMPKPKNESSENDPNEIKYQPVDNNSDQSIPTTRPTIQDKKPTARERRAPSYSFTTSSGITINNDSQSDRVTVLYFWGSWCVPCNDQSPLVSDIVNKFNNQPVDVFGLAIREADPDQTTDDFNSSGFNYILSLDADSLVGPFKARVFPSIVVINKSGVIVYHKSLNKDVDVQELASGAETAITDALE